MAFSTWLGEEAALAGRTEGSIVSVGLRLLKRSEQSGLGAAAGSWIGSGPDQPVSPNDVGKVAGGDY